MSDPLHGPPVQTSGGKWIKIATPDYDLDSDGDQFSYLRLGYNDPEDPIENNEDATGALSQFFGLVPGEVKPGTFLFTHGDYQNVVHGSYTTAVSYGGGASTSYFDSVTGYSFDARIDLGSNTLHATGFNTAHYLSLFDYSYSVVPYSYNVNIGKNVSASNGYAWTYAKKDSTAVSYTDTISVFKTFEVKVVDSPTPAEDAAFFGFSALPPYALAGWNYIKKIANAHAQSKIYLDRDQFVVDLMADKTDIDRVALSASVPGPAIRGPEPRTPEEIAAGVEHHPRPAATESMIGIGYDVGKRTAQGFKIVIAGTQLEIQVESFKGCEALANYIREIVDKRVGLSDVTRTPDDAKLRRREANADLDQARQDAIIKQLQQQRSVKLKTFITEPTDGQGS